MSDLSEQIQVLLEGMVESGAENGVQAAVYRRGELVADVAVGAADPATGRPVTPDTVFFAASTAKGVAATVVHVLAERGVLDYDTRIAELWPEFGAHGKDRATVRHALTHSAGVPALPKDLAADTITDWDAMCALTAGLEPRWVPGERAGYHPLTFGFLLGEIVRRATGRPISRVLAEDVAGPLGVADELYFGVPAAAHGRLARFTDDPAGAAMFASVAADLPLFNAGPPDLTPGATLANRTDLLAADAPSWGVLSARAVARMYAALLDEVDGVRLVSPARLRAMSTVATSGTDEMTGAPAHYGLGYTVGTLGQRPVAPTVFGMVGVGGSAAYADTATGITVAVTKNRFNPVEINAYDRVHELAVAVLS
ncbi:serine hydrolase domain-containing protein [Actinophytocola sp.]|uniref:serine hydrolase domain-containing protein n=1 Tax=Actinophytocola sp. TaxID=1872138 RepID=UPI003D6C10F7